MSLIIGILGRPKNDDREFVSFSKAVSDVIISFGYIPLGIIAPVINPNQLMTDDNIKKLHKAIDLCDGFILQGGSDYYQYDIEAIKYIYDKKMPLLGICLGMQTMGVVYGATLISVPNHNRLGVDYVHPVSIEEGSKLHGITETNRILVNSRHNDMIINPSDIEVVGINDSVIEAIEKEDVPFFLGVQWHPEDMLSYDKASRKIFEALFLACQKYHNKAKTK
ncbi:MAG: gamma-glutamyl-gamma-aminobutyrate hydrolase family protein [Bacilli bacterium]|nr:gamma-glutamyl-gamma-aminobutyrate hydrolase family protein [Bacilli bacterium]